MKLGDYHLGKHNIVVHTDMSGDGGFEGNKISIGLKCNWTECLNICLHELIEMCCSYNNCRLGVDVDYGNSNDCYTFLMTHPQFADIIGQVSCCLVELLPDLEKAHNDSNTVSPKSRRKREKRSQSGSRMGTEGGGLGDTKV